MLDEGLGSAPQSFQMRQPAVQELAQSVGTHGNLTIAGLVDEFGRSPLSISSSATNGGAGVRVTARARVAAQAHPHLPDTW